MTDDVVKRLLGSSGISTFILAQSLRYEVQHLSDLEGVGLLPEDLTERLDKPRPVSSVSIGHISPDSGVSDDDVLPADVSHLEAVSDSETLSLQQLAVYNILIFG